MQGFNMGRYVPPELEGVLSFNQASGKKPTNRKPDGSQTVRFECPFAIWCTTCTPEAIIGQGVRFNAEKRKVGNYYSTPIWSFRLKHTVCGGWIEVRTDPKNAEYVVFSGGRRRDTGEGKVLDGEILIGGGVGAEKEKEGAFGKLEKQVADKETANTQQKRIEELRKRQERDWADPYEVNRRVRKEFRVGRRARQADERSGEALQERFGLGVDMVSVNEEDGERAKLVDFGPARADDGGIIGKGMFENRIGGRIKSEEKDRGKRGKADSVAERKLALQSGLKGNTRAKSDPFIKDKADWQTPARRKRNEKPVANDDDKIDDTHDSDSLTDEAALHVKESAEGKKSTTTINTTNATLVAYDSD